MLRERQIGSVDGFALVVGTDAVASRSASFRGAGSDAAMRATAVGNTALSTGLTLARSQAS
ncbi:hypothetical protein [Steroidobacter sp.]|uniref:hypothetical protein n=1 Tax=Steroidobacter sp. TaxID=1978227 RepID=UPI002EDB886F